MADKEEVDERSERIRSLLIKYKYVILIFWLILSVILLVTGAILLGVTGTAKMEYIIDYTHCDKTEINDGDTQSCRDYLEQNPSENFCDCIIFADLSMNGEVTLLYELPEFDQTLTNYSNSKDNDQLRGILTKPPSDNCKSYQYDNNKTIVPCGVIADSMLFDEVRYIKLTNGEGKVDLLHSGMLSADDKVGFHNPENLTHALQNFSKPYHWPRPIDKLDDKNEDNNGFQNEFFISWMKTDWKRKPVARVNHSNPVFKEGLPKGRYQISISNRDSSAWICDSEESTIFVHFIAEPTELSGLDVGNRSPPGYTGERRLILSAEHIADDTGSHKSGAVMLALGILMLIAGVSFLILIKLYYEKKKRNEEVERSPNVDDTNPSPLLSG